MTVRDSKRCTLEYVSFKDWPEAQDAPRTVLDLSGTNYCGAPQVFYFRPQKLWYLIYQVKPKVNNMMVVACSTSPDIRDPGSWSRALPLLSGGEGDSRIESGLDFWVICDGQDAHLFFTSMNGKLWHLWTEMERFPHGFRDCRIALTGPFYEASHTYKLKGQNAFLTLVEEDHRRHFKAYRAESLRGEWKPLADTEEKPFAGFHNISPGPGVPAWTDNISHGELIRDGFDETLTVDPTNLQVLFQGMLESEKKDLPYAFWPWRLGLLSP